MDPENSSRYNLYNLEPEFKKFLLAENVSPSTLKNYLSDFRFFAGWITKELRFKNYELRIELLNKEHIEAYKAYLIQNNLPLKTINRRLSTVRKFCSFCISQGWMKENPAKQIRNSKSEAPNKSEIRNPKYTVKTIHNFHTFSYYK